ncbi:hypothetical protein GS500_18145 [Rhodococcus hoagii]|nr:hypothetical protein [Prescottella equi]
MDSRRGTDAETEAAFRVKRPPAAPTADGRDINLGRESMSSQNDTALVVPFQYESNEIRAVEIDGRRWAVAADICRALDIKDVRRAVSRLDEADRLSTPIRSGNQNRNMLVVSEDGATDLVLESRKPEAKRFRRFLTHEVWPSIRDTGSYGAPTLAGPELMAAALIEANKTLAAKETAIATLTPKAAYVDTYVADTDLLSFSTIASSHDLKESQLRQILIDAGWIYAEEETRWSDSKGRKEMRRRYSEYAHKKPYFRRLEVHEAPRFRGEVMHTLKITAPGAEAIARNLPRWTGDTA